MRKFLVFLLLIFLLPFSNALTENFDLGVNVINLSELKVTDWSEVGTFTVNETVNQTNQTQPETKLNLSKISVKDATNLQIAYKSLFLRLERYLMIVDDNVSKINITFPTYSRFFGLIKIKVKSLLIYNQDGEKLSYTKSGSYFIITVTNSTKKILIIPNPSFIEKTHFYYKYFLAKKLRG